MNKDLEKIGRFLSQYKIDLLVLGLFVLLAMALAERPNLEGLGGLPKGQVQKEEAKAQVQGETSDDTDVALEEGPKTPYVYLAERNIFVSTGSYEPPKTLPQIPENPYNLVAVLKGNESRAVFREFTGNILVLKVGDQLIDGAVVEAIGDVYVTVKKEDGLRDYRIFEVKGILSAKKGEPHTGVSKGQK